MVAAVRKLDPLFFDKIEDPLPLESTLEYKALAEHRRLEVTSDAQAARAFVSEFDGELRGKMSRLVDFSVHGEQSVARGVRAVLGLTRDQLSDDAAIERVLSPKQNPYLGEALVLTTVSKLTRVLSHAHYTFQKKLSHTADSQDQRHRMTPASRPVLQAHFAPGLVDVVVPDLIAAVPEAHDRFLATAASRPGARSRSCSPPASPPSTRSTCSRTRSRSASTSRASCCTCTTSGSTGSATPRRRRSGAPRSRRSPRSARCTRGW